MIDSRPLAERRPTPGRSRLDDAIRRDSAGPRSPAASGRLTLELIQPVALGTPDDFLRWVNRKFDAQIPSVTELAAQVPGPLQSLVEGLLRMQITIDAMAVETGPGGRYRFAASVDLTAAPPRLGTVLALHRIGFRIERHAAAAPGAPAA